MGVKEPGRRSLSLAVLSERAMRTILAVIIHTLVLYFFLIFCLRVVDRRQMGQMTVFDLVVIIVLGSAVETSMVAGSTSLQTGLVSASTLLVANRLLTLV